MHLDIQTRKTLLSRIPASWASGYPNAASRYRQAGHLYIQSRDFASESDPCKQGICPDICSNRACARYRQAMHLSYNSRFAVTGKLGICPPNAKNDRFPEIGKRSFCLPGLLGKSLKPSCAVRHSCAIFAKSLTGDGRRITKSSSRRCTSFALSRSARSRRRSPAAGQASRGFLPKCRRRFR